MVKLSENLSIESLDYIKSIDKSFCMESKELDLSVIARRIIEKSGYSTEFVKKIEKEYKRFLELAVLGYEVVPSQQIDDFWHNHVLDTRKYREDCAILGEFIDHCPDDGSKDLDGDFDKTLDYYREYFGEEPPKDIWE
jgi:hypothetical protein